MVCVEYWSCWFELCLVNVSSIVKEISPNDMSALHDQENVQYVMYKYLGDEKECHCTISGAHSPTIMGEAAHTMFEIADM